MNLEQLAAAWRSHERKLDAVAASNAAILRTIELDRTRSAVRCSAALPLFELACDVVLMLLLGSYAYDHRGDPRMLLPGVLLLVGAIALVATAARQLAIAARVDYGAPVVAIQREIDRLAALRLAKTRAVLVTAPLVWALACVVVPQGLFGVDMYALVGVPYLAANLAFGLATIPLALWLGRRWSAHAFWRRLRDDIVGTRLAEARARLDAVRRFEREA